VRKAGEANAALCELRRSDGAKPPQVHSLCCDCWDSRRNLSKLAKRLKNAAKAESTYRKPLDSQSAFAATFSYYQRNRLNRQRNF
jgi:hypothetical protein